MLMSECVVVQEGKRRISYQVMGGDRSASGDQQAKLSLDDLKELFA